MYRNRESYQKPTRRERGATKSSAPRRRNTAKRDRRIVVIDTSVFIRDPNILYKVSNTEIVVPGAVIGELDGLKRNPDPQDHRAKAARKVSKILDRLGSRQDILAGAITPAGSTIRISNRYKRIDDLASKADNKIVGTALKLKADTGRNVIILSRDGNMRNIARGYGIQVADYPYQPGDCKGRLKDGYFASKSRDRRFDNRPRRLFGIYAETRSKWVLVAAIIAILLILLLNT